MPAGDVILNLTIFDVFKKKKKKILTPSAAREELPLTPEPPQTTPHVYPDPCDPVDGRSDQPCDEKNNSHRPAGNPKLRQPKRTMTAPQRPWLTPPAPSNMAWRGWTTSKTAKLKVKPIREPQHLHDFSLSANERPRRRTLQTSRLDGNATRLVPNKLSGTAGPPTHPCPQQPPPWGKSRRNRKTHHRHTQTTHKTTPIKNMTKNRTPTLTSTPHDSYVFSHDIYSFSHDIALFALTDWEMKAG